MADVHLQFVIIFYLVSFDKALKVKMLNLVRFFIIYIYIY